MTTSTSDIYERLVSLLTRCPQTIEILPGDGSTWLRTQDSDRIGSDTELSFSPYLFVEDNLGVPQKILYKAYLHAINVFKSARTITVPQNGDTESALLRLLTASSSVLLLANPSHQTALNSRKRLVRMHLIDPHDELRFVASLLSSQHCAKHAELWYHRRWLLSTAYASEPSNIENMDSRSRLHFMSQETVQRELRLVSRACELYPRNYFAWTHRLICMRSLLLDHLSGITVDFVAILHDDIGHVKGWIDRHVSDYSAVHYVLALSQTALQGGESSVVDVITKGDLLAHAISLVQEYPTHEALWVYAWSALCILDSWKARRTRGFVDYVVQPLAQSRGLKTTTEGDLIIASKFAKWFLDKREAMGSLKVGKHKI